MVETVNPMSLYTYAPRVLGRSRPRAAGAPELSRSSCSRRPGSPIVDRVDRSPVPADESLELLPGDDELSKRLNENFDRINALLFGAAGLRHRRDPMSAARDEPSRPASASIRCSSRRRPATRSRTSRSVPAGCCAASGRRRCSRGTSRPRSLGECCRSASYRPAASRGTCLMYHASIGEPTVHDVPASRAEPIVLVYHNITPGRILRADDLGVRGAARARAGARSRRLRPRVVCAIADSHYNARELEAIGYHDVRVIPPVVDSAGSSTVDTRRVDDAPPRDVHGPILLFVGQLLPHKRPDFLVKAMHVAATYLGLRGDLLLVGQNRLERYTPRDQRADPRAEPRRCHVVGAVDDAELAAMFRRPTCS